MIQHFRTSRIALVAALSWCAWSAMAHAQTPTDSSHRTATPGVVSSESSTSSLLRGGVMGEMMAVTVPRSKPEIQRLLDEARNLEDMAETEIRSNSGLATEAEGRAKIMHEELNVTLARRDAAKKAKDKVATAEWDATYKKQERQYKYLTQLQDATKADADRLQSAKAAAQATSKSLQLEMQLSQKQAQLGDNPPPQAIDGYRSLMRSMLQAQGDAADRTREASDKRKKLVEERLKQLNALSKLGQ